MCISLHSQYQSWHLQIEPSHFELILQKYLFILLTFRIGFSTYGNIVAGHRSHLVFSLIAQRQGSFLKISFFLKHLSAVFRNALSFCTTLLRRISMNLLFFNLLISVSVAAPRPKLYKQVNNHIHNEIKSDRRHLLLHWAVLPSIYMNMGMFSKVPRLPTNVIRAGNSRGKLQRKLIN